MSEVEIVNRSVDTLVLNIYYTKTVGRYSEI